jgi:hypothetical protein
MRWSGECKSFLRITMRSLFYGSLILVWIPDLVSVLENIKLMRSGKITTWIGGSRRRKSVSSRSETTIGRCDQPEQRRESCIYLQLWDLMIVECRCWTRSRTVPGPSAANGIHWEVLCLLQIEIYSPDSLIVGTRGRDGAIGGLLPGSMSKYCLLFLVWSYNRYCLQHSPVPVIVVHSSQRRLHRRHKREKDPDRQSYIQLLKLAKEYSSSSESLAPTPNTHGSAAGPGAGLDTPGSLSPDEDLMIVNELSEDPGNTDRPPPQKASKPTGKAT